MPCKSFMIADLLNEETLTKPPQYSLPSRPVRVRGNDNEFENVKQISWLWHWLRPNDEDIYVPSSELELVNLSVMSLASIVGSKVVMEIPIPAYVRGDSNSTLLNCTPKRRNRTVFTGVGENVRKTTVSDLGSPTAVGNFFRIDSVAGENLVPESSHEIEERAPARQTKPTFTFKINFVARLTRELVAAARIIYTCPLMSK